MKNRRKLEGNSSALRKPVLRRNPHSGGLSGRPSGPLCYLPLSSLDSPCSTGYCVNTSGAAVGNKEGRADLACYRCYGTLRLFPPDEVTLFTSPYRPPRLCRPLSGPTSTSSPQYRPPEPIFGCQLSPCY